MLTAAAVHFGFQATVTAVVYPALARVPARQWTAAHRAHSRAITPVVAVVSVTAVAAAPAHGRLAAGYDAQRIGRLLIADRIRAAAATIAFAAAILVT